MTATSTAIHVGETSVSTSADKAERQAELEVLGAMIASLMIHGNAVIPAMAQAIEDKIRQPEVQTRILRLERAAREIHRSILAVEAPGYVPYFEGMGHGPLLARLEAAFIKNFARRLHVESEARRIALSELHDLARRTRWHPALILRVARLRDNCSSEDFLADVFRRAGCPEREDEFWTLLRSEWGAGDAHGPRLIAICKQIAGSLPSPRGRHELFRTTLHQTFLNLSGDMGGRRGFTYGLVKNSDAAIEDYIDEATAATRIELKDPSFNPTAARYAERKRLARSQAE